MRYRGFKCSIRHLNAGFIDLKCGTADLNRGFIESSIQKRDWKIWEFGGSKGGYRTVASLQTGRQGGTRASRRVRSTQRSRRMQRMRTLLQRPRPPLALLQLRLHERAAGLGTSATIPAGVFAVAARPRPRHRESRHPPLQQALSAGMA